MADPQDPKMPEKLAMDVNPGIAVLLATIWPGSGQIFGGEFFRGFVVMGVIALWLLLTPLSFFVFGPYSAFGGFFRGVIGVIGFIGVPIVWIWSIFDAASVAKERRAAHQEQQMRLWMSIGRKE